MPDTSSVSRDQRKRYYVETWYFPGAVYGNQPPIIIGESSDFTSPGVTYVNSRVSNNAKGWRNSIKNGRNATGSLTGVKQEHKSSFGTVQFRFDDSPGSAFWYYGIIEYFGHFFPSVLDFSSDVTSASADNQALTKFYQQARAIQTKMQGLVVLGELGQTLRGITRTAKDIHTGLFNYLSFLRRKRTFWGKPPRRPLTERKVEDFLADSWLEWAYGFKPLFSDIDNAMAALASEREFLSQREQFATEAKVQNLISESSDSTLSGRLSFRYRIVQEATAKYYGSVSRFIPNTTNTAQTYMGYDPSNFIPSVYELIPYSFLLDYFTNVQEIVSAYSFNRSTLNWWSLTSRIGNTCTIVDPRPNPGSMKVELFSPGSNETTNRTVVRRALDTNLNSLPSLEFEIPGASMKWLNMAALATSHRRLLVY